MMQARPIFHPSDFSPASGPAFRKAMALAKGMRRPLLIVHVMSPVTLVTGDAYIAPNVWPMLEQSIELVARRGVTRLVKRARAGGVRASSLLLRGVTHEAIVRAARRHRAEMIVIGTHGRTGVKGMLLGSVASRVVSHAACPVMTVHGR
jgi:nucleotide-binding universal stress UspA family protein